MFANATSVATETDDTAMLLIAVVEFKYLEREKVSSSHGAERDTTNNSSQFHSTQSPFAFNSMNESHVCKTISSQNVFNVWYPCALECWTEIMRVAFLFVTHFPIWLSSKCPPQCLQLVAPPNSVHREALQGMELIFEILIWNQWYYFCFLFVLDLDSNPSINCNCI